MISFYAKLECLTLSMDKTGTITKGELKVKKSRILDDNIHKINLLYSLLDASTHPVSISIKKYLVSKYDLESKNLLSVKNIEAKGMSAIYENFEGKSFELLGGNIELLKQNDNKVGRSQSVTPAMVKRRLFRDPLEKKKTRGEGA